MLKIFNNLRPFFEDNYRRIAVREYGRMVKISPPHASSILKSMEKEGLLLKEEDRNYLFSMQIEKTLYLQNYSRHITRESLKI